MNLSTLTSNELESCLEALDAWHAAYDLIALECMDDDDDFTTEQLGDAIIEEMTKRAMEDAGYIVNEAVARGELDRYVRPDGEIGYAPPGAYDEAQA